MVRRTETAAELRQRIFQAMQRDIGVGEKIAGPFVDVVMACFAGERLYFPAAQRCYPLAEIENALKAGASVKEVILKFQVSRTKLYELFPGGLPRKADPELLKFRSHQRQEG